MFEFNHSSILMICIETKFCNKKMRDKIKVTEDKITWFCLRANGIHICQDRLKLSITSKSDKWTVFEHHSG